MFTARLKENTTLRHLKNGTGDGYYISVFIFQKSVIFFTSCEKLTKDRFKTFSIRAYERNKMSALTEVLKSQSVQMQHSQMIRKNIFGASKI